MITVASNNKNRRITEAEATESNARSKRPNRLSGVLLTIGALIFGFVATLWSHIPTLRRIPDSELTSYGRADKPMRKSLRKSEPFLNHEHDPVWATKTLHGVAAGAMEKAVSFKGAAWAAKMAASERDNLAPIPVPCSETPGSVSQSTTANRELAPVIESVDLEHPSIAITQANEGLPSSSPNLETQKPASHSSHHWLGRHVAHARQYMLFRLGMEKTSKSSNSPTQLPKTNHLRLSGISSGRTGMKTGMSATRQLQMRLPFKVDDLADVEDLLKSEMERASKVEDNAFEKAKSKTNENIDWLKEEIMRLNALKVTTEQIRKTNHNFFPKGTMEWPGLFQLLIKRVRITKRAPIEREIEPRPINQFERTLITIEGSKQYTSNDVARIDLPEVLICLGEHEFADSIYQGRLESSPSDYAPHLGLAWIRSSSSDEALRDGKDAVELASRAIELIQQDEDLSTEVNSDARSALLCISKQILASAHAENGSFELATLVQKEVVDAIPTSIWKEQANSKLKLYESGKPLRKQAKILRKNTTASELHSPTLAEEWATILA